MELNEALLQISAIRHQMARTEQFRGYRATPVAFSGLLAIAAGFLQSVLVPEPMRDLGRYLLIWMTVAAVSLTVCLGDIWLRYRRSIAPLHQETTHLALGQFFPCLVSGGLLTIVIAKSSPEAAWMLPGLWAILFSMGLFASWRLLPRSIFGVALYFLISGLSVISQGNGSQALAPWIMPQLFGVGQLLTAAVLLLSEQTARGGNSMTSKKPKVTRESQLDKSKAEPLPATTGADTGRYAYEGLDRTIHEKARLGILTSLAANPGGLLFGDLKDLCSLTDGNLSRHLQTLQDAGFVEVWKRFQLKRPQTLLRLTELGRQRLLSYIAELERVVADAATAARSEAQSNSQKHGELPFGHPLGTPGLLPGWTPG